MKKLTRILKDHVIKNFSAVLIDHIARVSSGVRLNNIIITIWSAALFFFPISSLTTIWAKRTLWGDNLSLLWRSVGWFLAVREGTVIFGIRCLSWNVYFSICGSVLQRRGNVASLSRDRTQRELAYLDRQVYKQTLGVLILVRHSI